ncbi:MAG: ribonuclease HI [Kiritimatiellae bacterium]|nr:ribonuclease HI [Kiritimatiellia bacterium]
MKNHIEIYTDGACSPNPGPGGYGVIVVQDGHKTELMGGFRNTTNNRMEMLAAIEGLKFLNGNHDSQITVYSDSRYVVDMLNGGYAEKWRANGWMLTNRKQAQNSDLWSQLLDLTQTKAIQFEWVKGHNEHPENERCDEMAVEARQQNNLPVDNGYEITLAQETTQLSLFDLPA